MSNVENHTVELLQKIHKRLDKLDDIELEMREGFAAVKHHQAGFSGDVYSYERRLINLEDEFLRMKSELEKLRN